MTKENNKNGQILYLIPYSIYCFISLAGGSELIQLNNTTKIILYAISTLFFGMKVLISKVTKKELIVYILISIISIYAYLKLDTIFFFMNFLAIVSLKNVNIKNVVKIDILIKSIFLITHVVLYGIDYFFDYSSVQQFIIDDGKRIRHAFYFTHPNIVNAMVFWMIMDVLYLRQNIRLRHIVISLIVMLIMYNFTKSRTMLFLFIIFLSIYYIEKFIKNKNLYYNIIYMLQKYIIEFFTILSIGIGILYQYNIHFVTSFLNALTSGRVYYSYVAIKDFGINLMCNVRAINLEKYLLVDNFYVRCAVLYGLIFVILIMIMTKLVKRDNKFKLDKIIFIILAISLFSEYFGIIIGNAIPLLLLGNMIINKKENKKN